MCVCVCVCARARACNCAYVERRGAHIDLAVEQVTQQHDLPADIARHVSMAVWVWVCIWVCIWVCKCQGSVEQRGAATQQELGVHGARACVCLCACMYVCVCEREEGDGGCFRHIYHLGRRQCGNCTARAHVCVCVRVSTWCVWWCKCGTSEAYTVSPFVMQAPGGRGLGQAPAGRNVSHPSASRPVHLRPPGHPAEGAGRIGVEGRCVRALEVSGKEGLGL